ncbi:MAG: hypothetical protein NVSMB60_00670 [Mycobacterium sp.]
MPDVIRAVPAAELKRIWTDSRRRRQSHARALVVELETAIAARGYRRVYLLAFEKTLV